MNPQTLFSFGLEPVSDPSLWATLFLLFGLFVLHVLIQKLLAPRFADLHTRYLVVKSSSTLLLFLTIFFFAKLWFNNFVSLATFMTMISVGLVIVLKEVLLNFFASIVILWRSPFKLRDRIQIGEITGDVVDLGLFYFTVLEVGNWIKADQSTGRTLKVPNALVLTQPIANFSRGLQSIWNEIPVRFAAGTDWEAAKAVMLKTGTRESLKAIDHAKQAMKRAESEIIYTCLTPTIYTRFDDEGITLTLRYLCNPRQRRDSEHHIFEELLHEFIGHKKIILMLDKKKA
ncbi:MAG: mechanosensitive ion channel [bacterium]|nr:mechanosensitive ion channel [bacterium]